MYVMNKKWDSITNIAQCTSVYVSPEHEIKAVPTGGGAVYRLGEDEIGWDSMKPQKLPVLC